MLFCLLPGAIAQYPRLSNLFKNNNKACLGSAQLVLKVSESTNIGSKVSGYSEKRGNKKLFCLSQPTSLQIHGFPQDLHLFLIEGEVSPS